MFYRFFERLLTTLKNKRALGTTIFTSSMIIGIGIPMLAVGWDINNMRTYKVDMDNITQMAILSVTAHSGNTYNMGEAQDIIRGVVVCNLNPQNVGGTLTPYLNKNQCGSYHVGAVHGDLRIGGDGTRRSSISGNYPPAQYRPGLTVTRTDARPSGKSEIYAQTFFSYKPMFLQGVVKNLNLGNDGNINISTKKSHVQARLLCIRDMDCTKKNTNNQGRGSGGGPGSGGDG